MKQFIALTQNLWNSPEGTTASIEKQIYHSNRMRHIDASEGTQETELRLIANCIKNNMIIATSDTLKVLNVMNSKGIIAISAHLKVVSRDSLKVLITVSDEDFVKESFLGLYSLVREIEDGSKTDFYVSEFTFINRSSSFNIEQVEFEGFRYTFNTLEES